MKFLSRVFKAPLSKAPYSIVQFTENFQSVPKGYYKCWDIGVTGRHFTVDGEGNLELKETDNAPMALKIPEKILIQNHNDHVPYRLILNIRKVIEAAPLALKVL